MQAGASRGRRDAARVDGQVDAGVDAERDDGVDAEREGRADSFGEDAQGSTRGDVRTNGPDDGATLPQPARQDVLDLAAAVLAAMPPEEVPAGLARVRAFAPARRARAGAVHLLAALGRDPVFRQRVAASWRSAHPALAEALDAGEIPAGVPPRLLVAGAHLLRPPHRAEVYAAAAAVQEEAGATARAAAELSRSEERIASLTTDIERTKAAHKSAEAERDALREELASLRRELRRHRADADRARAAQRQAEAAATAARASAEVAEEQLRQVREQADVLAAQWESEREQLRRAGRDARGHEDARLRLLLDTVVEAAAGLRRELALPPVSRSPADFLVDLGTTDTDLEGQPHPRPAGPARARPADDPAALADLLALPRPHLVVDGYNVTKTGYGEATLAEQRRRLLDALTSLAARTGAEITCCFDGAETGEPAAARRRGVRVVFSPQGVTADAVIRRLVLAEPRGRVVVVVSSDGEVAAAARAAGHSAVPATALLRLLARG